jgi:general secretion pathway protein D
MKDVNNTMTTSRAVRSSKPLERREPARLARRFVASAISQSLAPGASAVSLALFLAACQTTPPAEVPPPRLTPEQTAQGMSTSLADAANRAASPDLTDRTKIYKGTGVVVKGQGPSGALPPGPPIRPSAGGVVLNFEGADLREVIRNVLGDILNEPYIIDPAVGGTVTIRTSSGIPREALPATLETLLRMNGAAMIKEQGIWKVLPQAAIVRGNVTPQLGNSQRALPPGFSVQVVPLRFIGVREMQRILEPFARDTTAVRFDELRNLMIISGTEVEIRHLLETIDMFDIDWMAGMSAAIFTLQNSDVKTVMQEFDKAIGDRALSPFAGILRIIPIERMNAVLVVSPNPQYLEEAKKWITRLDAGGGGEGVRFYVFNLQNSRAEHVGPLLQQAFTGRVTQQFPTPQPTTAPGTPAGTIVNPPAFQPQPVVPVANQTPTPGQAAAAGALGAAAGAVAAQRAISGEGGVGVVRNVQIVADKDQNTIMIVATPSEYSIIEQALRKLDVPARQVMIDVTIAEVQLTDTLAFGVEWLFKGGAPSGRGSGGFFAPNGSTPFNPAVPLPITPSGTAAAVGLGLSSGFNYIINNSNFPGGVQAVLNLLDTYGNTKVIANPHLGAADNQKATIKAGDRIPICQQTIVGGTTNAVTTTSQYIDTGVLLQVTPHINDGGLVTLDVQAEVSVPGTPAQVCDAPPISTRSVQTLIAVPSGRTMVMGGLIQTTKQNSSNGFPLLDRIPILGGLFGKQQLTDNRTELILFITPRVIDSQIDNERVIQDLRKQMELIDHLFPPTRGDTIPPPPPPKLGPFDIPLPPPGATPNGAAAPPAPAPTSPAAASPAPATPTSASAIAAPKPPPPPAVVTPAPAPATPAPPPQPGNPPSM